MLILSVDPGALRGAYAVLDASGSLLEVADLPKVADHKTRWVDAPVLLSRLLEIKPVATLRRRIPSSIATTRHSGGAGRFRIRNKIASSSSGLNGPSNTTSLAKILPMNERVCSTTFFASSIVIVLPPGVVPSGRAQSLGCTWRCRSTNRSSAKIAIRGGLILPFSGHR